MVRAEGNALYQSTAMSTTNNGVQDGYESISTATGGIDVIGGNQHVEFFSSSNVFDGQSGTSRWASTRNTYSGGIRKVFETIADLTIVRSGKFIGKHWCS